MYRLKFRISVSQPLFLVPFNRRPPANQGLWSCKVRLACKAPWDGWGRKKVELLALQAFLVALVQLPCLMDSLSLVIDPQHPRRRSDHPGSRSLPKLGFNSATQSWPISSAGSRKCQIPLCNSSAMICPFWIYKCTHKKNHVSNILAVTSHKSRKWYTHYKSFIGVRWCI